MELTAKFAFVAIFAGVAMLITGSLPTDKMERVRAFLGDTAKPDKNKPPVRLQLLVGGAAFLFAGLVIAGVIHPSTWGDYFPFNLFSGEQTPTR
jgi:hypothetical protein